MLMEVVLFASSIFQLNSLEKSIIMYLKQNLATVDPTYRNPYKLKDRRLIKNLLSQWKWRIILYSFLATKFSRVSVPFMSPHVLHLLFTQHDVSCFLSKSYAFAWIKWFLRLNKTWYECLKWSLGKNICSEL